MNTTILIAVLVVVLALNIFASIYVGRAPAYEKAQKVAQIILIWALPVIGATIVIGFLWNDRKDVPRKTGPSNNTSISEGQAANLGSASSQHHDH